MKWLLGNTTTYFQHDGYICYCNEPNCNKDEQCTCNNNPALQCQVCQLEDHMCDGESDNGKSETCLEGEVCVMLEESYDGDMRYYRMCEKHDKPNDCEIFNEDVVSFYSNNSTKFIFWDLIFTEFYQEMLLWYW